MCNGTTNIKYRQGIDFEGISSHHDIEERQAMSHYESHFIYEPIHYDSF